MKLLITLIFLLPITILAQTNSSASIVKQDSIFSVIDEMPQYPGGFNKMKEFIEKNIIRPPNYPKGKVYIKFIIDKTGKVTNPTVLKGLNASCDKASIDVILKLPKFSVPKHNGKPIDCPFNIPIEFK